MAKSTLIIILISIVIAICGSKRIRFDDGREMDELVASIDGNPDYPWPENTDLIKNELCPKGFEIMAKLNDYIIRSYDNQNTQQGTQLLTDFFLKMGHQFCGLPDIFKAFRNKQSEVLKYQKLFINAMKYSTMDNNKVDISTVVCLYDQYVKEAGGLVLSAAGMPTDLALQLSLNNQFGSYLDQLDTKRSNPPKCDYNKIAPIDGKQRKSYVFALYEALAHVMDRPEYSNMKFYPNVIYRFQ